MLAILQNLRSVHNVGSIFRIADAASIEKIYLCGTTPLPVDRFGKFRQQFVKVSLGAEKNVSWEKVSSAASLIELLKKNDYKIFALEQALKSIPYYKVKIRAHARPIRVALVVGNEIKGLSKTILSNAHKILEIPMRGKTVRHARHPKNQPREGRNGKESLNVAVVFGIVAFHLINTAK